MCQLNKLQLQQLIASCFDWWWVRRGVLYKLPTSFPSMTLNFLQVGYLMSTQPWACWEQVYKEELLLSPPLSKLRGICRLHCYCLSIVKQFDRVGNEALPPRKGHFKKEETAREPQDAAGAT